MEKGNSIKIAAKANMWKGNTDAHKIIFVFGPLQAEIKKINRGTRRPAPDSKLSNRANSLLVLLANSLI